MVELLVVVALILALAGLTIVVTQKVLQRSREAAMTQALRQVSVAHIAFTQDQQGAINTIRSAADSEEGGSGAEVTNSYWGRFVPYLFDDVDYEDQDQLREHILRGLSTLFQTNSPENMTKTILAGSSIFTDGSGLPVPLAFNQNVYLVDDWVGINQLTDPGMVVYATLGFEFFDETDGDEYVQRPTDGTDPDNNIYYLDSRKAMVIFADGRVGFITPPMMPVHYE